MIFLKIVVIYLPAYYTKEHYELHRSSSIRTLRQLTDASDTKILYKSNTTGVTY